MAPVDEDSRRPAVPAHVVPAPGAVGLRVAAFTAEGAAAANIASGVLRRIGRSSPRGNHVGVSGPFHGVFASAGRIGPNGTGAESEQKGTNTENAHLHRSASGALFAPFLNLSAGDVFCLQAKGGKLIAPHRQHHTEFRPLVLTRFEFDSAAMRFDNALE